MIIDTAARVTFPVLAIPSADADNEQRAVADPTTRPILSTILANRDHSAKMEDRGPRPPTVSLPLADLVRRDGSVKDAALPA
jgi:hypothetical protein